MVPDTNCWECVDWNFDSTQCSNYERTSNPSLCDSMYIDTIPQTHLDPDVLVLVDGSVTATVGCCMGRTGDIDISHNEPNEVDLTDLGKLVDFLFSEPGTVILPCPEEADVDAGGGANPVDLTDLGKIVDYLFSTPGTVTLPACP
jgi:hypothetical protein